MSDKEEGARGGACRVGLSEMPQQRRSEAFRREQDHMRAWSYVEQLAQLSSPLKKGYEDTFNCRSRAMLNVEGWSESRPCSRRWCYRCRRTQWGERFYPYIDALQAAHEEVGPLHLVTLTTAPCRYDQVAERVDCLVRDRGRVFKQVATAASRRGEPFVYFWKLEGAVSRKRGVVLYRPHLHIIVAGVTAARDLIQRWEVHHRWARAGYHDLHEIVDCPHNYDFYESEADTGRVNRLRGIEGFLGYLAKGIVSHESMKPMEADTFYRALHGKHIHGASRGLKRTSRPRLVDSGPLPEEIGGYERRPDGLWDIEAEELVAWDVFHRELGRGQP